MPSLLHPHTCRKSADPGGTSEEGTLISYRPLLSRVIRVVRIREPARGRESPLVSPLIAPPPLPLKTEERKAMTSDGPARDGQMTSRVLGEEMAATHETMPRRAELKHRKGEKERKEFWRRIKDTSSEEVNEDVSDG